MKGWTKGDGEKVNPRGDERITYNAVHLTYMAHICHLFRLTADCPL